MRANNPGTRHRTVWGKSGLRGVYNTREGRWLARIRVAGALVYLGTFATAREATDVVTRELERIGVAPNPDQHERRRA